MNDNNKVISLFSGAGGLDLGLKTAGFDLAITVEKDADCIRTLDNNWNDLRVCSVGDVCKLAVKDLLTEANLEKGEAALVVGGAPCQPFSKSGYWATGATKRLADNRADTIRHYFRVVGDALPRAIIFENVVGIGYRNKDEALKLVKKLLRKINRANGTDYRPTFHIVNAASYGVPQTRERFFMVAHREGRQLELPRPTHGNHADMHVCDNTQQPYSTAWDAIGDLAAKENDPLLAATGKWADLLPSIPEGQNYLWHTSRGGGAPIFGWRTRYWSFLLKLQKTRPSWTLQASPGPATGPLHWDNRRLSIREMCRIQTFPDSYEISGSYQSATKQIGNAVPPAIGELFGKCIMEQFFDTPKLGSLTLIPKRRQDLPKPNRRHPIRKRFLDLASNPAAHPGHGKGPRARARVE